MSNITKPRKMSSKCCRVCHTWFSLNGRSEVIVRLTSGTKGNCVTCSDSETCVDTEAKATLLIVAVY